jgi:hypothetical protein
MSQFSEHDPFTQEMAFLQSVGKGQRRGRWQRKVIRMAGLLVLAFVVVGSVVGLVAAFH